MDLIPDKVFSLLQSAKKFPVDFDEVWAWIGYSRKDNAKAVFENCEFLLGTDFVTLSNSDFQISLRNQENSKTTRKGRPAEKIWLSIDCFKMFCMMAGTSRGREVRLYFLRCEEELKRRLEEDRQEQQSNTKKKLISAMVSPDVVDRTPKFPDSYYQMLYRKYGRGWENRNPKSRPQCVAQWTMKTVYDRLLGGTEPGGIKDTLNEVNPRRENGTRKDRHHWHFKQLGIYHLNTHLYALAAIANTVPDGDWDRFMSRVAQAFPNDGEVIQMSLFDLLEDMEREQNLS